ncbi:hypothetical protein B0T26DRAFT_701176 [Lasiosphaeria miniovina]|uniref:RRM domain-containing protein n=1 Tax=Lasiosphaeria miniovina TaxID=1954250 RepID=A0AA40E4B7_9PEZI|nr:uncharacterized protein B0T26DRAFT_701176 [Lasiosphaeria miniovina]KAK0722058.1 hypothetical protein B0T26DRAFT_701176 [Lasiosphaeria miniovina]
MISQPSVFPQHHHSSSFGVTASFDTTAGSDDISSDEEYRFRHNNTATTATTTTTATTASANTFIPSGSATGSATNTTVNPRVFEPMVLRPHHTLSSQEALGMMIQGFSPRYKGDPLLERNRSAAIPPDANCSLFVIGLAPDLTTRDLLAAIRDTGRVYATHINPPEMSRGHATSAAKIIFFERAAAERFYNRFAADGFLPGNTGALSTTIPTTNDPNTLPTTASAPFYSGRVVWNRIRSAETDAGGCKSRVLLISGPAALVSEPVLHAYFSSKMEYQVDEVRHLGFADMGDQSGGHRALVEFRFGSYRCQAEAARMALSREFKEYGVVCEFGRDPCDRIDPPPGSGYEERV